MKRLSGATTKLEKRVQRIVNSYAADYDNGVQGFMEDLQQGGCQSGLVGGLIYYRDTLAFYRRYRSDINLLLYVTMNECGCTSPADLLRDWDKEDPLCEETHNQNLLAWFAFEKTAFQLARNAGLDI